jgi:hypothetical protein
MDKLTHDLAEALKEAIDWNWLDEETPPPADVRQRMVRVLDDYERQLEQSERDKQNLYP